MKDSWELIDELNCIEIDDDGEVVENVVDDNSFKQSDSADIVDKKSDERVKHVVQSSTLCATIIALLCEIMNLVEVIVNYVISYSMFTLSFTVIGVFATIFYFTKINESKKLLACGIVCLVFAFAFAILWFLNLFGII